MNTASERRVTLMACATLAIALSSLVAGATYLMFGDAILAFLLGGVCAFSMGIASGRDLQRVDKVRESA